MASYHLSVKILSRSSGRSGVAAAAYRSRSQIKDVRQGMTFDYSKKSDLGHAEILAPQNAPSWMLDRAKLWNGVEASEKRKDAQIMREVEVALPVELRRDGQIELLREFCMKNFVSEGMVADICVHQDLKNPHAHIMLTMRKIEEEGFGKKVRSWNSKKYLLTWREDWANIQNVYLAKAGFDKRVDHRSNTDRGISVEAQVKRGVPSYASSQYEYDRTQEYKRIAFENGERIIADPKIALDHISRNQSTFTHDDILKYVHSHCDDSQFYRAVEAINKSPELFKIDENDYDRFSRYTTISLLRSERSMLIKANEMGQAMNHCIAEKYVKQARVNSGLSDEQSAVLNKIARGGDLNAIIGDAGTGKSYTLRAIREAYESAGYTMQGVALAGVAAEGLENSSGIRSATIHRKLFDWDNERDKLNGRSVLVIDEAGMVGTRQMHRILSEAKEAGAKTIVVGDTKQTQAVEAGGAFRGIIQQVSASRLRHVWRQKIDWHKEATRLFAGNTEDIHKALDMYNEHGNIAVHDTYGQAASAMLTDYVKEYHPGKTTVMTAHRNEDIERLNLVCRNELKKKADVLDQDEFKLKTSSGVKYFTVGDRVLFLRNERSLGVKNGTLGTVADIDKRGSLTVAISKNKSVVVDTEFYNSLTYGYAATVHKLQGATIDKCYFLASESVDRHIGYVAMSRHENNVRMYYSQDKFQNFEQLKRRLSSLGEKELLDDYNISDDHIDALTKKLTAMNATFTDKDLDQTTSDLSPEESDKFFGQIELVGQGRKGENRYSTVEMVELENKLFKSANAMGQNQGHALDTGYINGILSGYQVDDKQRFVVKRVASGSDLAIIDYQHGTDRANVARIIGDAYQRQGYVVEGLSLSNMGAENFKKDSGIDSSTVYKRLWEWDQSRNMINDKSVLFIDNASMIGTRQTQAIVDRAEKAGAKVIMFGDQQYLQSIDAGGAHRRLSETAKVTKVTLVRNDEQYTWKQEAMDLLKGDFSDAARAVDLYAGNGCIHGNGEGVREDLVSDWMTDVRRSKTYQGGIMLAYTNKDVDDLNDLARSELKAIGYVDSTDVEIITPGEKKRAFARGDRIMFMRKDNDLQVNSGTFGTLRNIEGETFSVRLDTGQTVSVDTRLYNDLAHGYAATVYRSAGIRTNNAYILATKHFNKHATQAALQCHRKTTKIYHSFKSYQELKNYLCRSGDKDLAADYPLEEKVYRISVKVDSLGKTFEKTISQKPELSQKIAKSKLRKEARKFAHKVCLRNRIDDPGTDITVSVKQLEHDQAREYFKNRDMKKDASKQKGRGPEIGL